MTPFCAYAKLPAAVAPVTAATVVPTISFALNPSLDKAGTNTTAPPKPVIAETIPAKEPEVAADTQGTRYLTTGFAGMAAITLGIFI